ncbi:hypothetical protein A3E65_01940 [Candidatus Kaiserbacteria bacterium RIFCSPHIGHO2_12_FULL_56_13]|uniref:DNA-directed DNA polymerase n=1 Tax=Candidatus Kaiserbacteria bacterium RIFCSPHIGHO2_12_FULL_56_13 TaxID=1798505 RepID=A0A1F6EF06_9BACT|nr:MAG: hypothetical protein A3E65_01940 [Candidatus Kaiserbacteria bacterium RIFCSPHIGHO2_12_FULL_56_13]
MAKKTKDKKRLVLLDTHAIIHRAYHALPEFTGPGGQPTGALYGLAAMLIKIIKELKPDYLAATYDLAGPTVRHEAYGGYKAMRAKIDDSLSAQINESRKVFEAFSIPIYERAGFEADDLLGTIAHTMSTEKGIDVIIASGDMDALQLVDDARVRVYTLKRGLNDTILYDEKAVKARYGFGPKLIADYKGLCGDPSDNIKGVPGVGDKTATELITKFGSIEDMYKKLAKDENAFTKKGVKPRTIELLKKHKEDAEFSKSLALIRTDAPIAFALSPRPWREGVSADKVLELFDTLGFRSLRDRARGSLGAPRGEHEGAGELFPEEKVDPERFKEAQVMLWLLASEFTNPTLPDLLAYAKAHTFDEAYHALEKSIAETGCLKEVYAHIEKPLIDIVTAMEERGVLIDPAILEALAREYRAELEKIERRIYTVAGREFNISSPQQLGAVLFDELELVPERHKVTPGGARSTRESELEKLRGEHPIIADILEYRELKKLLSTYIENLPPLLDTDNRLHAEFVQTGTTTGRMASQNPNLQNIPLHSPRGKAIRNAFVAPRGFSLIALDYSQIELRIAAVLSGDEKLRAVFRAGRDVHREVAAMVFGVPHEKVDLEMRRRAKVINFGILYGMGVNALRAALGVTTVEAHKFYDDYFRTFKTLTEYLERTKGFARKHGYTETLFGRRRQFPEMRSPLPYVRAQAERMAINAPMQGTQADIIKLAMVRVDEWLKRENLREETHLLLQVHDELVYEVRSEKAEEIGAKIKEIMESVLPREKANDVPIIAVVKTGKNWGEMTTV